MAIAQENALSFLRSILADYGLPESLLDWARRQIELGHSEDRIALDLWDTPEFERRFPAIKIRREQGLSPLAPDEYIAYETAAGQLMRSAGLPEAFYSRGRHGRLDEIVTGLIAGDVSPVELQSRIEKGYSSINKAPAEIRAAFDQLYGTRSREAMLAVFVDPERGLPELERMTAEAQIEGYSQRQGFSADAATRADLARLGLSEDDIRRRTAQVGELDAVFGERISEGTDLTAGREGLEAAFQTNSAGAKAVERRIDERKADVGGEGKAVSSQRGITGLGAANS